MGWNYRKSVNLGGGVRLNFSKSGIGISGGVKGFRVSHGPRGNRLYASIPGTGIYYTKNLSSGRNGGNRSNRRTNTSGYVRPVDDTPRTYQYTETVTNDYTGETRTLRAYTRWELTQLVEVERERQKANELRFKQLENVRSKRKKVAIMTDQVQKSRNEYSQILKDTLDVDDRIDWKSKMSFEKFPDFNFNEPAPKIDYSYKLSFWKSLFMNEKKFEIPEVNSKEMDAYESRRNRAIYDYIKAKNEFNAKQNNQNGEMDYLKRTFESGEQDSIEKYISLVLSYSKYPADFEHDFDISYNPDDKSVIVNYLFQDIDSFPITEKYEYNDTNDEIEEVLMDKQKAEEMYRTILYRVAVRTIHEIYESVYTGVVNEIKFNGFIVDEGENQCAFTMKSDKNSFLSLDLRSRFEDILFSNKIEINAINDFTLDDEVQAYV